MVNFWSDYEVEKLKKLIAERMSAGQIAELMPSKTRSAVIGKAHRLGIEIKGGRQPTRKSGWQKAMAAKKKAELGPKKPQSASVAGRRTRQAGQMARIGGPDLATICGAPDAPLVSGVEEIVIPLAERKSLVDLDRHNCRWPIGDPQMADFHFCGKTKVPGLPYCSGHVKRAYQPPEVKKPKREVVEETVSAATETVPVVVKEVVEA